ncbi:carboxypeptidase Y-like [Aedes aegypti]|uniref:Uncharacterized protein n=1 Tax=Aedes aegypti TaxID=7159 RepID=A0A6I8U7R8_AEDAE|nr:carboxypeptidase Y-like [Aedes aegypti]
MTKLGFVLVSAAVLAVGLVAGAPSAMVHKAPEPAHAAKPADHAHAAPAHKGLPALHKDLPLKPAAHVPALPAHHAVPAHAPAPHVPAAAPHAYVAPGVHGHKAPVAHGHHAPAGPAHKSRHVSMSRSHYPGYHVEPVSHGYHAAHNVIHHAYAVKAPHVKCGANILIGCAPEVAHVPCIPVPAHKPY